MSKEEAKNIEYHYPIKIVCGDSVSKGKNNGIVAPGKYFTAVNVHNPSLTKTVTFRRKVAIALPGAKPGPVSGFLKATLKPDEALEVDCPDLMKQAPGRATFIKGFLVIISPVELDIVAVYTASGSCCEGVVSMHTERVPGRRMRIPCEDLDLTLNTGKANWMVVERPKPDVKEPEPVNQVPMKPSSWKDLPATDWVTSGPAKSGTYRFELCFCLCDGFEDALLKLDVRTDNDAKLLLNGQLIGSTPFNSFSRPATHLEISDQSMFRPGDNCLEVQVNNQSGPTGFSLAGFMAAKRGRCPE
jgi:hypothetical protein